MGSIAEGDAQGSRATTKRRERRKVLFDKKQKEEKAENETTSQEKKKGEETPQHQQQEAAAAYLKSYHRSIKQKEDGTPSLWKFNKNLQVWLMRHAFDTTMV